MTNKERTLIQNAVATMQQFLREDKKEQRAAAEKKEKEQKQAKKAEVDIVEVIKITVRTGSGLAGDPLRDFITYWTLDGHFLTGSASRRE